jgi:hypothetical protein
LSWCHLLTEEKNGLEENRSKNLCKIQQSNQHVFAIANFNLKQAVKRLLFCFLIIQECFETDEYRNYGTKGNNPEEEAGEGDGNVAATKIMDVKLHANSMYHLEQESLRFGLNQPPPSLQQLLDWNLRCTVDDSRLLLSYIDQYPPPIKMKTFLLLLAIVSQISCTRSC